MNTAINPQQKQPLPQAKINVANNKEVEMSKSYPNQSFTPIDQSPFASQDREFDNEFDQMPIQTAKDKKTVLKQQYETASNNNEKNQMQKRTQNSKNSGLIVEALSKSQLPKQSTNKQLKYDRKQVYSTAGTMDATQMQVKIKEMAKSIRQRVKKQPFFSTSNEKSEQLGSRAKNSNKFEQQSHKFRRDVVLSPINRPNINALTQETSKLLTFQDNSDKTIDSELIAKSIVKNDILGKVWRSIDIQQKMKKNKLKLDPIKHKYPITTFRKAVIAQFKQLDREEQRKERQRQEKLQLRRIIYNSSRYDRYIKRKDIKQIHQNENMVESLVLLKHQDQPTIVEENPEVYAINSQQYVTPSDDIKVKVEQRYNQKYIQSKEQVLQNNQQNYQDEQFL